MFGHPFEEVGPLALRRGADGLPVEYTHSLDADVERNKYGNGPFCTFQLSNAPSVSGVYVLVVAGEAKYVGECRNLQTRMGPGGYGDIAARNCHRDGQATNCRINNLVLQSVKGGADVVVWFLRTPEHRGVEAAILARDTPPWNRARGRSVNVLEGPTPAATPIKATAPFERVLAETLREAEVAGKRSLQVRAGDLHRQAGGQQRVPSCCNAMRKAMLPGDRVIQSPPKGSGTTLTVEYGLPRPPQS